MIHCSDSNLHPITLTYPVFISMSQFATTGRHRILILLLIFLGLAGSQQLLAQQALPDLGDYSEGLISQQEQARLGREFMRNAQRHLPYINDPDLLSYLNKLGQNLVSSSDAPTEFFHFYWVADDTLNAFAVPGGHITVHTGLIMSTTNESELAGVLAHEIAHITQRHLPRMLARQKQLSIPSMAAVIAGVLLGGQAGLATIAATNAAVLDDQLRYSRSFETEADTIGIHTIQRSGFDPRGMHTFFDKLYASSRLQESNVPEFLRTHPLTLNRITAIKARTEKLPPVHRPPNDSEYLHIRAKIGALYSGNSATALNNFKQRISSTDKPGPFVQYGFALALSRSGKHQQALQELTKLADKYSNNRRYQIAIAYVHTNAHEYAAAARILKGIYEQEPNNPIVRQDYADNLLISGNPAAAKQILRSLIQDYPKRAIYYEKYAKATADTGEIGESHFYLAQFFMLKGEATQALNQLHIARRQDNSFYLQASIDARIAEVQEQLARRSKKKNK